MRLDKFIKNFTRIFVKESMKAVLYSLVLLAI